MVHVIATIECIDGKRDALLEELRKNVPNCQAEDGCIAYGPTVDIDSGIGAQGPLLYPGHEIPGHPEIHVRFQQGAADLPQGFVNILFGQASLVLKPLENPGELVGQIIKQYFNPLPAGVPFISEIVGESVPASPENPSLPNCRLAAMRGSRRD